MRDLSQAECNRTDGDEMIEVGDKRDTHSDKVDQS